MTDTRDVKASDALFGGPMVAGCLYAPQRFLDQHPETCRRLARAVVRAERLIAQADPDEIMKHVPKAAFLGNPELYRTGLIKNRPALSADGRFPEGCAEISAAALASVNPALADFRFNFETVFTNAFVDAAKA